MDLNTVALIGRAVRDPELKTTSGGTTFCKFTLASTLGFGDNEKSGFFDCVIWGKRAEVFAKYIQKGNRVGISGNLDFSSWETESGKRSAVSIRVNDFQFLEKRKEDRGEPAAPHVNEPPPPMGAQQNGPPMSDEEIPF